MSNLQWNKNCLQKVFQNNNSSRTSSNTIQFSLFEHWVLSYFHIELLCEIYCRIKDTLENHSQLISNPSVFFFAVITPKEIPHRPINHRNHLTPLMIQLLDQLKTEHTKNHQMSSWLYKSRQCRRFRSIRLLTHQFHDA